MPLIPSQQNLVDAGELIRVTVNASRTVRGVKYFKETDLLLSPEFAKYLIGTGDVRYNDIGGMHLSDPDSFKGAKGPND